MKLKNTSLLLMIDEPENLSFILVMVGPFTLAQR